MLWIHPDRAKPLGIADGDEVEVNGGGATSERIKAKVTPWIHPEAVFMLHGYGATVPLATRAHGRGVADQRLQHGKLYDFDPAGGGNAMTETIVRVKPAAPRRRGPMSNYILHHDEANCIGCQACEVHCKTNKNLGPGPAPVQDHHLRSGRRRRTAAHALRVHALLPLRGPVVRQGLSDRAPCKSGRRTASSSSSRACCIGCKSCIAACPWGTPQWDPATRKVVKCDYCMDRIDAGLQPACVTTCVTGCLSFGLANELPDPRRERYAR